MVVVLFVICPSQVIQTDAINEPGKSNVRPEEERSPAESTRSEQKEINEIRRRT